MLQKRPIVNIVIGYILGIIMGLYFKKSIVLLYILILGIYLIIKKPSNKKFKLISFKRYFRYIKIIINKKVCIIIIISSIFSNCITLYQNDKYDNLYKNSNEKTISINAIIVSNVKEREYKNMYKIKVKNFDDKKKYENTYLYINVNKNIILQYGDIVQLSGEFEEPKARTNYKAFDYKEYLKSLKVYGTINVKDIKKTGENNNIFKYANNVFLKIKEIIQNNFDNDIANVLLGIILGYTDEINDNIKNDFQESNI